MREFYNKTVVTQTSSSAGYFVGFIGAAIYFIQHAAGFWAGVLGFLKACVWPAFVVYHILEYLKL